MLNLGKFYLDLQTELHVRQVVVSSGWVRCLEKVHPSGSSSFRKNLLNHSLKKTLFKNLKTLIVVVIRYLKWHSKVTKTFESAGLLIEMPVDNIVWHRFIDVNEFYAVFGILKDLLNQNLIMISTKISQNFYSVRMIEFYNKKIGLTSCWN